MYIVYGFFCGGLMTGYIILIPLLNGDWLYIYFVHNRVCPDSENITLGHSKWECFHADVLKIWCKRRVSLLSYRLKVNYNRDFSIIYSCCYSLQSKNDSNFLGKVSIFQLPIGNKLLQQVSHTAATTRNTLP